MNTECDPRVRGGVTRHWAWWLSCGLWLIGLWMIGCSAEAPGVGTESRQQLLEIQGAKDGATVGFTASGRASKVRPTRGLAPGQQVVWVQMRESASLTSAKGVKDWKARGKAVYSSLTSTAKRSQAALTAELERKAVKYRQHWVVNTIRVEADEATIQELSQRSDVARVVEDRTWAVPPLDPATPQQKVAAVEWNIDNIRAPEAWVDFGTRGEGVVVATIDTGAEWDHPALVNQYRGSQADGTVDHNYNWFDPSNICGSPSDVPCDNYGHGTHTMGTIVGDDGGENQIGVAPGAKWITAKGCEEGWCSNEALLASGEWMLAPTDLSGANPRPDLRPQIVSNSWGGWAGDDFYRGVVEAWVAAGIFPVFANGNDGPYCGSAASPGDYPESYGVGAYDINEELAYFSARGPSLYDVIKPNISAPGVDVRSSVPGGYYEWYSGTSMATPHVAGSVALLWSAAVAISGDIEATRELLDVSAIDHDDTSCGGEPENNNAWGQGQLDVYEALYIAPIGPTGSLTGSVTNSADGAPVAGARVLASGGTNRATSTDDAGAYTLRLPAGDYSVSVAAFGFLSQDASATIEEDATASLSFALERAPSHTVAGTVVDADGAPIAGAEVTLQGTPLHPETTDESGFFEFPLVPEGEYVLHASRTGCYLDGQVAVVVDSDESVVVPLDFKTDAWGYQCRPVAFEYIPGENQLELGWDDDQVNVSLPFAFSLYGQAYDSLIVTTNGYAAFISDYPEYWNESIPNSWSPNAAMYVLWDDLVVNDGVYTATLGEAPNRQFVIEWRNSGFYSGDSESASFELVLGENGAIVMQYASADSPMAQGSNATIGIENAAGDIALPYSYNEAALESGMAVRYEVPYSGFVQGVISDANDGAPVSGATVTATNTDGEVRVTRSGSAGTYLLQLTQGYYTLGITKPNYTTVSANVVVVEEQTIVLDFPLQTAIATLTPATLQLTLPQDALRTRTFVLRNEGSAEMQFEVKESGGAPRPTTGVARMPNIPGDLNARTTEGLFSATPLVSAVTPSTPGDIISSFVPVGLELAWGIGEASNLWLSDAYMVNNHEFGLDGTPTGVSYPAPWSGSWPGDMAFDEARGLICQLAVGGDNGIHCWNPATGEVEVSIGGGDWSYIPQRGLAYRAEDDVFFVGGWNEGIIYQVKGASYDDAGAVISSCMPPDWAISGLAYNSSADVLWMATNSETDTIYELNPDDCTLLSTLAPPQGGSYQGAGLELDAEGNLWAVAQSPNQVYLMESGVPSFGDIPWLVAEPASGAVGIGSEQAIEVTVDTMGLEPGLYLGTLVVKTSAARQASIRVPVSLVVSGFLHGINCGGSDFVDGLKDAWEADRAYSSGGYGYVQRGTMRSTRQAISGTEDDGLYQSQRENAYAYRFDNVPNGTYQLDLNFAEIQRVRFGQRLFDVIVEDETLLPAHDIAYEVGTFAADPNRFQVEVTDGQLDVRLVSRTRKAPVINALRVIHRPDL